MLKKHYRRNNKQFGLLIVPSVAPRNKSCPASSFLPLPLYRRRPELTHSGILVVYEFFPIPTTLPAHPKNSYVKICAPTLPSTTT